MLTLYNPRVFGNKLPSRYVQFRIEAIDRL